MTCQLSPSVGLQMIWSLENEREARGQEATEAAQRHAQALEEVKLRDMAAADLQKKVRPHLHQSNMADMITEPLQLLPIS